MRKVLLWTGIIVVVLLLVGSLSAPAPDDTASDSDGSPSSAPQATSAAPTLAPEPDRIDLAGRGDHASDRIPLETGLALFVMRHGGQANFIVELLGPNGETVALLANEIGGYQGSVPQGVAEGDYVLSIRADGPWSVGILQPRPTAGTLPPLGQKGTGDYFVGPVQLSKGLARFELSHNGDANFIVILMNRQGEWVDLLANKIGAYSGSRAVRAPYAGIYWLGIKADGDWTATVTQ